MNNAREAGRLVVILSALLSSPHIILFTSRVDVSHKSQSFWVGFNDMVERKTTSLCMHAQRTDQRRFRCHL